WLGWLVISHNPTRIEWSMQGMLAGAALLAGTWSGYCRWREWSRPRARLQELLPLVRSGVMPIEELSDVGGGMGPLVPMIQELMRDLRQQRGELARLNDEIRQRVAHRTDALERMVGSLRQQATKDPLTGLYNRRIL